MYGISVVAIVAMFFAFLVAREVSVGAVGRAPAASTEVILYIDPPPSTHLLNLSLPDRNPNR